MSAGTYVTILWIILVSLLLMTTIISLVLVIICKHNKNRMEKKKALEKYSCNREESASLYEREGYPGMVDNFKPPRPFEDNLDTYRQLSTESDISFSNPLYRVNGATPPRRSEVTLISEILSDSGCSTTSAGQDSNAQLLNSPC